MKKVLVATGTSEHKKAFAVDYIKEYLTKKEVEAEILGANIYEVKIEDVNPDVIVTIGLANFSTNVPIIQGAAFVMKRGMDEVCDAIIDKLK
ncbi:MAG: hypothetical protein EOM19_06780 [Candidatus Moranbacteria bacterium]|nr:hypothetical protein [Candidatus Moranbacteria bacterium]